jgi:hypothetical protein
MSTTSCTTVTLSLLASSKFWLYNMIFKHTLTSYFYLCSWTLNFAASDPKHKAEWLSLMTPKAVGLILRSIRTDYKFVSASEGHCASYPYADIT